jgi:hypothetical protein
MASAGQAAFSSLSASAEAMGKIATHVVRKQLPATKNIPLLGGKNLVYGSPSLPAFCRTRLIRQ